MDTVSNWFDLPIPSPKCYFSFILRKLNANTRNPVVHDRICSNLSVGRKVRLEGCSEQSLAQIEGFHVISFTFFLSFWYYLNLVIFMSFFIIREKAVFIWSEQ